MSRTNTLFTEATPKCKAYKCNHPLDPEEWDCDEKKCIELGECKYLNS